MVCIKLISKVKKIIIENHISHQSTTVQTHSHRITEIQQPFLSAFYICSWIHSFKNNAQEMIMYKTAKSKTAKTKRILQNYFNNFVKYAINEEVLKTPKNDK